MAISDERRTKFLCEVRAGSQVKPAAEKAGIPRSTLYKELSRDRDFAAELQRARNGAEARDELTGPPTPYTDRLSPQQIAVFVAELQRSGSVGDAAIAACVDLRPNRLNVVQMTPRQRRALRDILEDIRSGPRPDEMKPKGQAQWALDRWLAGDGWPDMRIDVDLLRQLSPKAAQDYRQHLLVREAERVANEP